MNTFKRFGAPKDLVSRCAGIYFALSALVLFTEKLRGTDAVNGWRDFVAAFPFGKLLFWGALVAGAASLLYYALNARSPRRAAVFDPCLLLGGTLLFASALVWRRDDVYLCIGACLVALPVAVYAASEYRSRIKRRTTPGVRIPAVLTATLSVLVTAFVCVTTAAIHRIFATNCFDMGIFVQMYHSMAKDLSAVTTCERGEALSHFRIHASYILYLLAPVYKLFPNEVTLIVSQGVIAVSGIVPFFLIAKGRGFRGGALFCISAACLFSVGILVPCRYHFHENAFLPPLLFWLFYAAEKRNAPLFLLFSALVCTVKEDAPLYVVCIALYFALEERGAEERNRRCMYLLTGAGALLYLFCITKYLKQHGDGAMMLSSSFGLLTTDAAEGLFGVVKNALCDPGYFFSLLIYEKSLILLIELFLPLLFLPFMTKKPRRFLLLIPFAVMNLVIGAGYGYAAELGYQYTFGPAALLLYVSLVNLSEMRTEKKAVLSAAACALSIVTACALIGGQLSNYEYYIKNRAHFQRLEDCLDTIPQDGTVLSNTFYLPHIADRDEIYRLDDAFEKDGDTIVGLIDPQKYDYIVLNRTSESDRAAIPCVEDAGFAVFAECGGDLVIYAKPEKF